MSVSCTGNGNPDSEYVIEMVYSVFEMHNVRNLDFA